MTGGSMSGVRWVLGIIFTLAAAGLSAVVTMFTLPNVLPGVERAKLAATPIATSPSARAAAAAIALVENQSAETLERAERLATKAILDDPLEVSAIRSLSFVHAYRGEAEQSMRLLHYGESLSRRDLMTELALAMEAKAGEKNHEAIRHYGHALSTTRRGYDVIVAQVLKDSRDHDFASELGSALADNPNWRDRFLPTYVARNEDPYALTATAKGIWPHGVSAKDRSTAVTFISRLLRLGAPMQAAELIKLTRGDAKTLVQNGDFEDASAQALGWRYESGASLSALSVPDEEGRGRLLEVHAGSGHLGPVARQMLALSPGNYKLSARLIANEQADSGMPRVSVRCAASDSQLIEILRSADGERVYGDFVVEAECPVQLLDVVFGASMFVTDSRGYVDDIAIDAR
jgi:hypothetical protein